MPQPAGWRPAGAAILIDVSTVLGVEPGYVAHSVMTFATSDTGAVVMMFGAQPSGTSTPPTYVAAVDVSTAPAGALPLRHVVGTDKNTNAAGGQVVVVVSPSGPQRVAFEGSKRSTFFVGEQ